MGMIISMLHLYGCSVFSYQRRFPVVYLTIKVMLRPRFVNEQHEVCAFCVSMCEIKIINNQLKLHAYAKNHNLFSHVAILHVDGSVGTATKSNECAPNKRTGTIHLVSNY